MILSDTVQSRLIQKCWTSTSHLALVCAKRGFLFIRADFTIRHFIRPTGRVVVQPTYSSLTLVSNDYNLYASFYNHSQASATTYEALRA